VNLFRLLIGRIRNVDSAVVRRFRYDEYLDGADGSKLQQFVLDLLNSPSFQEHVALVGAKRQLTSLGKVSDVSLAPVRCSLVTTDLLQRFQQLGIVTRSGYVFQ